MTPPPLSQAPAAPDTGSGLLWKEAKALLVLGTPMALTQLVQFSVQTIDIVMIGHLGPEPLAAAALASVLFFITFIAGFGPVMAVSPLVSQALGADRANYTDVRLSIRMGFWAVLLMFPAMLAYYFVAPGFALLLGQPEHLTHMIGPYILALGPGLPFMMGVIILRNFLAAIDRTRMPLIAVLITTLTNALLNYVLIFGHFGFPRLELVGAGIASTLAHAAGFFFLLVYVYRDGEARKFRILQDALHLHWGRLREIIRLGWPMGASFALEALFFNCGALIMGRIGTNEVAAFQIGLNVAAMAFMLPFGLSMAGAVRVGLAEGARDAAGVRRAAAMTVVVCVGAISLVALPVALWPGPVGRFYLDADDPANHGVLALIRLFLPVAAGFMLFDATQVAANQALRGLKDVNLPLLIVCIAFWIIGFPIAYGLSLHSSVGAVGVWYGFLVSLAAAAAMLGARLYYLVRPRPREKLAAGGA